MKRKKKEFEPLKIAEQIIKSFDIYRLPGVKNPQVISYNRGKYVIGDQPIELRAQTVCRNGGVDGPVMDNHIKEVMKAVKRNAPLIQPKELNNPSRPIIVFKNGVLNLETMKLESHSPYYKNTIAIPHNFNPDASCPEFDKFINKVLPRKVSFHPANFTGPVSFNPATFIDDDGQLFTSGAHTLIKQMMGYLLIPSTAFRKLLVLLGEGANGKSTFIEVVVEMVGRDNVSHQSLHALTKSTFSMAAMYGKLVNTCADLEDQDIKNSGLLKQIVSGDSMQYEKKFLDPFSGPATARLLFSANRMPAINDPSKAMADRLILIDWPVRIEEGEQDKMLLHKLTTGQEIEGIIARYAIPGLQSLLRAGQFEIPPDSLRLLNEYRRRCGLSDYDHFAEFVTEHVDRCDDGESVTREAMRSGYLKWCKAHEVHGPLSEPDFNTRISERFGISKNSDFRPPGSRRRGWKGIKLSLA